MSRKSKKLVRVALCGRRNVGKSTLFNTLLGKSRAITDAYAGLTRDVLEAEIHHEGYRFLLSDTPGLDIETPDELEVSVMERAHKHLEKMDLVLMLFEAPSPTPFDFRFIEMMRKSKTPVLYVINKVDGKEQETDILTEFYNVGLMDLVPLSAKNRRNVQTLLKTMRQLVPRIRDRHFKEDAEELENTGENAENSEGSDLIPEVHVGIEPPKSQRQRLEEAQEHTGKKSASTVISDGSLVDTRIAIVGKPNAGKSSLFNKLVQKELSLVSDIPGTTRDTLDTVLDYKGKKIRMIDTAGLRRNSYFKVKGRDIDFYSISRAKRAIQDSRVVLHLIDVTQGITDFDKKIAALIVEHHKPAVLALNKWDVVEKDESSTRKFLDKLEFHFPQSKKNPVVFCSALTGQRVHKLIDICLELEERMRFRINTAILNSMVIKWNNKLKGFGSGARIQFVTQAEGSPPTFIFFVNKKKEMRGNYLSYFENRIRDEYNLEGVPITIFLRDKESQKKG